MECKCDKYKHLELIRKDISARIKESKQIKKELHNIANFPDEYMLYRCSSCGQLWQGSRAWNWGNDEYLFKVPEIEISDWLDTPYASPDEMLVYSAVMQAYNERNSFDKTDSECRIQACKENAIRYSVFCKQHHIESLQASGNLPKAPYGRLFSPYFYHEDKVLRID